MIAPAGDIHRGAYYYFVNCSSAGRKSFREGSQVDKSRSLDPDFVALVRTALTSRVILYQSSGYLRPSIVLTK
jgi:hypothetical protein